MLWDDSLRLEQAMWNLTCCDQKILLVLMWAVLSRIKIEEMSYWKLLAQGGEGGGGCCAVTLHLTSPTLQELSQHQQIHMSSLTFPTIFPWAIAELLGIIPRKLREMTIRITLWRLWERKPHKEIFCSKMHKVLLNF